MLHSLATQIRYRSKSMLNLLTISYCVLLVSKNVLSANETDVFTISTRGCTIRRFPLVSDNIEKLVRPPRVTHNCSENMKLVDTNSTHIWIIEEAYEDYNIRFMKSFYCCYQNFESIDTLENVLYGNCIEFKTIIPVNHEFVRVECFYLDDKMYDDFFVFKNINHRNEEMPKHKNNSYNVLIFGIESTSRMNFHRTMAKTSEFLRLRGSIELLGYNKLGDNSYPNLFPLLMGHTFDYVKRICLEKNLIGGPGCPFIWDKYKKAGYITALGSDSIAGLLGEYEYNLTKVPTDYYLQPVMYEARHLFKDQYYNYHKCLGSKYFYKILLDYVEGLTSSLRSNRVFGMFWEESVSHEDLNNAHIMDSDYTQLLTNLEDSSYLNETVVIFLSDHGMRWGEIVHTEQGRQEERLPLLQVLFPKSFKQKYKRAISNLLTNSRRLTTPFDMYRTLLNMIDPDTLEDDKIIKKIKSQKFFKQSSLFLPVSRKRTCKSIGILEHWCACDKGRRLKVGDLQRILASQIMVKHVNDIVGWYPQCQNLTLGKILSATVVKFDNAREYNVVVETYPGDAILDGTVTRDGDDGWAVSGTVSRLNRYEHNGCISDELAKLYCFCK